MASSSQDHAPTAGSALEGETIWIVQGSTGEYSDRSEWVVCAFRSREQAKAYVEFLKVERQKLGGDAGFDWDERERVETAMRAYDPGYSEDYTGTRWFIEVGTLR